MCVFIILVVVVGVFVLGVFVENYFGFNLGFIKVDYLVKFKVDFFQEFKIVQNFESVLGIFNVVCLYINIQVYFKDDFILVFEVVVEIKIKIFFGVWILGIDSIVNEFNVLKKVIDKYGKFFIDLVIGMFIGSEDLYCIFEIGIKNEVGVGVGFDVLFKFISDYKKLVVGIVFVKVFIGYVDIWDVYINVINKVVVDVFDWVGVDEYFYYESGKGNYIKNLGKFFDCVYDVVVVVVGGKFIWIIEIGWFVFGFDWDEVEVIVVNVKYYWQEIGCCKFFNKVFIFWYNFCDFNFDNKMQFVIIKDFFIKFFFDFICFIIFDIFIGIFVFFIVSVIGFQISVSVFGSFVIGGVGSIGGSIDFGFFEIGIDFEVFNQDDVVEGSVFFGKGFLVVIIVGLVFVVGVFVFF